MKHKARQTLVDKQRKILNEFNNQMVRVTSIRASIESRFSFKKREHTLGTPDFLSNYSV